VSELPGEPPKPSARETSFSTSRPVALLMVFAAAVVFGFFSYGLLPITLMPELSYPTLTVRTEYAGAAPEEVENDVSRPIEDALGVVGGLSRISSISRAGVSDVVLEFGWKTDMSEALQDTLEKLDLVFLPAGTERPLILRFDPSLDPVLELSLSGQGEAFQGEDGLRRLRRIAELQVRRALEPIPGVAAVRLRGGLEEEIHVQVDAEQLQRTGLSIQRVIDRLRQENVNVAGGTIQEGRAEYLVRTLNEFQSLDQIRDIIVATTAGRDVRIRDLASVELSHKEREIITRSLGSESVQLDIFKEADANMVALSQVVRQRLGELDSERPTGKEGKGGKGKFSFGPPGVKGPSGLREDLFRSEGVRLDIVADRSIFIKSSIDEVRSSAIQGGLLAVLVIFLFLRNVRSTVIIGLSIPISLLITFAPLNILGISLNIMSLGGLALGVGMLVDNSIVVLESIFRCREEGDDLVLAAIRGTREVRGAVIASTLTTLAVFFPMVFVEGVAGQIFGDLGLAVVASLSASLVVAVTFIPMAASRGAGLPAARDAGAALGSFSFGSWKSLRQDFAAARSFLARGPVLRFLPFLIFCVYLLLRFLLELVFELFGFVLLAIVGLFVFLARRVLLPLLGPLWRQVVLRAVGWAHQGLEALMSTYRPLVRWAVRQRTGMVTLTLVLLVATFLLAFGLGNELLPEVHQGELTAELALPVGTPLERTDATLRPLEKALLADPQGIAKLLVTIGYDAANSNRSDEGEHTARFKVLLASSDPRQEEAVTERLRSLFRQVPDLDARIVRPVLFSFRTPIEIEIHGDDLQELKRWSARARGLLAELPELADVESTLRSGAPELQILYDRDRLSRYGLDILRVAEAVRNSVKGFEATRFNLRDRRIPILVRYREEDRAAIEDVRSLVINPGGDRPIPLEAVAQIELGEGPSEVRRIDGQRVSLVRANLGASALGGAVAKAEETLAGLDWPAEMSFFLTGQNQEWQRSRGSLMLALGLSIFLVYVIMAAQFESMVQPLVIMLSIPLAFFGSFLALHLLGLPLSVMVYLGMIVLAGIVVNNAIVLVDYTNTLRRRGMTLEAAAAIAGAVRLRPILMTTGTTVLGLLPMALGLGDGAEIRRPMAVTVITGLVSSTALTLLIIPTLYVMLENVREKVLGLDQSELAEEAEEAEEAEGVPNV